MIIAIASGKGGTGKTTVSTALALIAEEDLIYLDCDVEEPNGAIFLKPEVLGESVVSRNVPQIDPTKCDNCGKCGKFCQFSAILDLAGKIIVMDEMCHSCGGCEIVCPNDAISYKRMRIGEISTGIVLSDPSKKIFSISGELDVGQTMAPPMIRAVKNKIDTSKLNIIDCPPGTSCPMITAVDGVDYVILVTEPTPFGLHDLKIAVATLIEVNIPFGVIINKADSGNTGVIEYCEKEQIKILLKINQSQKIAKEYSLGNNILPEIAEIESGLKGVLQHVCTQHGYTE